MKRTNYRRRLVLYSSQGEGRLDVWRESIVMERSGRKRVCLCAYKTTPGEPPTEWFASGDITSGGDFLRAWDQCTAELCCPDASFETAQEEIEAFAPWLAESIRQAQGDIRCPFCGAQVVELSREDGLLSDPVCDFCEHVVLVSSSDRSFLENGPHYIATGNDQVNARVQRALSQPGRLSKKTGRICNLLRRSAPAGTRWQIQSIQGATQRARHLAGKPFVLIFRREVTPSIAG